jgi:hypothetical protein
VVKKKSAQNGKERSMARGGKGSPVQEPGKQWLSPYGIGRAQELIRECTGARLTVN